MRRSRTQNGPSDLMIWARLAQAGQDMDRKWQQIRTQKKHHNAPPSQNEVTTNEEYPFGHGGVFRVPGDGAS